MAINYEIQEFLGVKFQCIKTITDEKYPYKYFLLNGSKDVRICIPNQYTYDGTLRSERGIISVLKSPSGLKALKRAGVYWKIDGVQDWVSEKDIIENSLNFDIQYYKTIPIKLVDKDYEKEKSFWYKINGVSVLIKIPKKFCLSNGTLIDGIYIDRFFVNKIEILKMVGVINEDTVIEGITHIGGIKYDK